MQTRFAKAGGASIAYAVLGDGPVDVLYLIGEYIPVDALDEEPRLARTMHRLASMARVIAFNRRGVGLSDAPDGPLTHEQHVDDALAVMDAVGSERAVLFGSNVSGPPAILFAAAHPERTAGMILANSTARYLEDTGYEGWDMTRFAEVADNTVDSEGVEFDFLSRFAPTVAGDERFRQWWDQAGHRGASPSRSRELWNLLLSTDVRDSLALIETPTLVLARDALLGPSAHFIADHIPNATYLEVPGRDLMWWVGDADVFLDPIESFLANAGARSRAKRRLATILFVDVVGSTERAVEIGDRRWREVLATYHGLIDHELHRFDGTQIGSAGDGIVATFDMPADAIQCAGQIAAGVRALDIDVRAGVHTGEIEILGDDVAGIGVHIAARVMSAAAPGEVLVSRTVCDLVIGSGIEFTDHGEHDLKGVPGRWKLFALSS